MILDLDIGNSRIKWRLVDAHTGPIGQGIAAGVDDLMTVTAAKYSLQRVRAACVRPGTLLDEVNQELQNSWQLSLEIAKVSRQCQGVTVGYTDLSRLGVDRWLAMLAAYQDVKGTAMVVDCGTALTVDLLDSSGSHQGGYIVPGLKLGPLALISNTGIRLESEPEWGLQPGHSSEQAVYHGALLMQVAMLEKVARDAAPGLAGESPPTLFLTGGDAGLLQNHLALPDWTVKAASGLVFDGLELALP